jgi:nuclear pore complex protein Nup133
MAAFTGSPPPRRKNKPPSRQAALEPPPRRVGRFASSRPASRLPTPARGAEQSSYAKDDGTVGSMDVDDDTLQPTERGLRQDTVFAKSEELLVTFHGHLPAEVKHVLRNAGECHITSPPCWEPFIILSSRLLPRRVRR